MRREGCAKLRLMMSGGDKSQLCVSFFSIYPQEDIYFMLKLMPSLLLTFLSGLQQKD